MSAIRGLSPYLILPAFGILSPLLLIPAVTHRFGPSGWASLAIAISLGNGIGTATEMGWGVVGPQQVAALSGAGRLEYYRRSITSRMLTVVPGAFVSAMLAFFLVPSQRVASAVLAGALSAQGMTPSWFFIGIGRPRYVMWSESVPRILITLTSAVVIASGGPLIAYSILMLLSVPLAQAISRKLIDGSVRLTRADWRAAPTIARQQMTMGFGRAVSVVYTSLPVAIVGAVNPAVAPVFAASERLTRTTVNVLATIPLRLQSWIGSVDGPERSARVRKAQLIGLVLGLTAGAVFAVAAPIAARFIFAGRIPLPFTVTSVAGLLIATICISTSLGLSLVAYDLADFITWAILPSAIVGVLLIGPGAIFLGTRGAIAGEVLAEITGTLMQWYFLRKRRTARSELVSGSVA